MPLPDPLITISPDFPGAPTFTGTRVPVQNLFDYLASGERLDEFLEDFPAVTRAHATAVLKASKAAVILRTFERESYEATAEELAAVDEAFGQVIRGERASESEVEAAFARFRK
jgi:uncharacterized protein (DUF433 family)